MTHRTPALGAKILSGAQVAALLGHSPKWFRQNRLKLQRAGFPKKDELLGGWHELAVNRWLAARADSTVTNDEDVLLRRALSWAA